MNATTPVTPKTRISEITPIIFMFTQHLFIHDIGNKVGKAIRLPIGTKSQQIAGANTSALHQALKHNLDLGHSCVDKIQAIHYLLVLTHHAVTHHPFAMASLHSLGHHASLAHHT